MKYGRLGLILLMLLVAASCKKNVQVTEYSIIPEPVYLLQKGRSFVLTPSTRLCFEGLGQNTATAKYITSALRQMHVRPAFIGTPEKDCITFTLNDTVNTAIGDEGYLLQVRPEGIFISANAEAGIFYGFQTLMQMVPDDIHNVSYGRITLPECTILDYPRFAWRGSHLDVCRHFFSVKQIEKHLDLMATYKLNKFHWHLTDDQGWRIEIEKYPALNDIGSWRVDRTGSEWGNEAPARDDEEPTYGGYYTKKEIAEIVEYAAQRNIEVIPEIEMPMHCSAVLAAYPQLSCTDEPRSVALGPCWSNLATLCVGDDEVMQFVYDVLDEVVEMFPSEYVHIGGEEFLTDAWASCPKCQQRMRQEGLKQEEQLTNWFVEQVQAHLMEKGRKVIGWDNLLDDGLTKDICLMCAIGDEMLQKAAIRGNKVISVNPDYCNLELYQADMASQPEAYPMLLTMTHLYEYDPMPKGLPVDAEQCFLGGECVLWTDYVLDYSQAEYQLLPRLCAMSECLWSPPDRKDWQHFQDKVEHHKVRLAVNGYNCCKGSFKPTVTKQPEGDKVRVTITTEVAGTYVYYTTDGTDPTPESPMYQEPLLLPQESRLRTLSLYKGEAQECIYSFIL